MSNNNILVVESNSMLRSNISHFLEEEGYKVHLAGNGKDGLKLFYEIHPILVLLDLMLPVMDGFEFLDHIKLEPTDPCAVIALTLRSSTKDVEKCFNYGVSGFLRKPINRSELKGLVKNSIVSKWIEQSLMGEINEHKQAEDELRELYTHNKLILTSISSILICVGSDDKITHWNSASEAIFSVPALGVIGKPFFECDIQWDWDKISECISTCRKERQPINVQDFPYTRPDKGNGFLNVTINPFVGQKATQPGFLLLGEEITGHKMLENEFNQAQKLKSIGQLASGVAHEINTPIQYIGDNMRFLKESFADLFNLLEEYKRFLDRAKSGDVSPELITNLETVIEDTDIQYLNKDVPAAITQSLEGIKRVTEIVKAMKEFSHPGEKEKTLIDINKSIESTITVARNEWKYVAEMKTNLDVGIPPIPCLPGEFNQVILNLIVNAADAIADVVGKETEEKGTITIETGQQDNQLEIRISDTGTGIPEEVRSSIFDPFFTTKEIGKGTGQGLSLAYSVVVEKHGGTITFDTEMGKGTTFIIHLPMGED